jgi:hypothetical protein
VITRDCFILNETGKVKHGMINPLNAELNFICHLLALLGVHHFLHVSRIRVKTVDKNEAVSHTASLNGSNIQRQM